MPSAARAAATVPARISRACPTHPVVHRVQVEGDDAAADQVEHVAEHVLLLVGLQHRGQQAPVAADGDGQLGRHGRRDDQAVVPPGAPQQHEDEREDQVELHDHEQEVQLVVADLGHPGQVAQGAQRAARVPGGQQEQEVDQRPGQVRDPHRHEPAPVEPAQPGAVPQAQPGVGVGQHARGDEEEAFSRHVQEEQRGVRAHRRRGGREEQDGVSADDARLLDRAHGVDLVEPAPRHQYIIRGSR